MGSYGGDCALGGAEIMWDTNRIIAVGLVIMGVIAVLIWGAISYKTGTSTGTEIPIGIISGLTGVLTGKKLAEYELREQQGKVNEIPGEAQEIVQATENLKDFGEK